MPFVFLLFLIAWIGTADAEPSTASTQPTVILAYGEYPPYYGRGLYREGFISEIVVKAYALSGYEVELVYLPAWQRSVEETKNGRFDGLLTMWHSQRREQWFLFSNPLPANEIGFYKHVDSPFTFNSVDDLASARVGTVRGVIYPPELEDAGAVVEEVTYLKQNIAKLLKQRIDMALTDKAVGRHILLSLYPEHKDDIIFIEPSLALINQHLVISRKADNAQEKLNAFNRGYAILKESGEIVRLATKYGIEPTIVK
ncbi:transporter substrate-binding domain-containing protein [Alteromonas ponticola]|uniref:Transporter substrate-binding domain-containing protein n=1 Tax=Alteromonas aquimaris TaxID=2998417 RepID=A0ABT3P9B1_9ALTE|nr:transporter substrate-binding domain-containing protein [Alteromonas aquimaris]MCW8109338.1 transporter substrate-binding domain-containing protein [Alteromonas aquimaris]